MRRHPDLAEHLMLFGQFVGAWDVDVTNIAPDGTKNEFKGKWHSCTVRLDKLQ